jgi:hypothetical protein
MRRRAVALQQKIGSRARPVVLALAVVASLGLSGCASMNQQVAEQASQLPHVGISPSAPARPVQQMAYPAVHDVPPPRTAVMLTDVEQHKLETDLLAARDQQQDAAGVPMALRKPQKKPAKPEAPKARTGSAPTSSAQNARPEAASPAAAAPASAGRIY